MSRRNLVFADGYCYHIFNRAVRGEEIFTGSKSLHRALEILKYYRYPQKIKFSRLKQIPLRLREEYQHQVSQELPYVELYAFSLMPDHYHFLLRQLQAGGVNRFISNFQNSYARYFNTRENRFGSLFQNPFKAKLVANDEQLLHLSRYIHLNPVTAYLVKEENLKDYPWTSLSEYARMEPDIVDIKFILGMFGGSSEKYLKFVFDRADYQQKLGEVKKLLLETQQNYPRV